MIMEVLVMLVVAVLPFLWFFRRRDKSRGDGLLCCPITLSPFRDPVVASDGHTYEREAIKKWLESHSTSPQTRQKMGKHVVPNHLLRTQINEDRERRGLEPLEPLPSSAPTPNGRQRVVLDPAVNHAVAQIFARFPELRTPSQPPPLSQLYDTAVEHPETQHLARILGRAMNRPQQTRRQRQASLLPERVMDALRRDDADSLSEEDGDIRCDEGDTLLHYAATRGSTKCAERFAETSYFPSRRDGAYPIHLAAAARNLRMVEIFLAVDGRANQRALGGSSSSSAARPCVVGSSRPLHLASTPEIVEVLLRNGADIEARDEFGSSPLHCAAGRSETTVVEKLLECGADPLAKDFVESQTPLHRSTVTLIAAALIDSGASVDAATSSKGDTPLHAAVARGDAAMINLLLSRGANIDIRRHDGLTPAFLAVAQSKHSALEVLLSAGCWRGTPEKNLAQVAVRRKDLRSLTMIARGTPFPSSLLLIAVAQNSLEIAEFLMRSGCDPNYARENDLVTPLHVVAPRGLYAMVSKLLENGADRTKRSRDGALPVDKARRVGDRRMINLLLPPTA